MQFKACLERYGGLKTQATPQQMFSFQSIKADNAGAGGTEPSTSRSAVSEPA